MAAVLLTTLVTLSSAAPASAASTITYVQVTAPLTLATPFSGATTQLYEANADCPVGSVALDASVASNALPLALDWNIAQSPIPGSLPPSGYTWTVIGRSERPLTDPPVRGLTIKVTCLIDTTVWPTLVRAPWTQGTSNGITVWSDTLTCPTGMERLSGGYWTDQVNDNKAISVIQNQAIGMTSWTTMAVIPGATTSASGEVFEYCLPTSFFSPAAQVAVGLAGNGVSTYTGDTTCPAGTIVVASGYHVAAAHMGVYTLELPGGGNGPNETRLYDVGQPVGSTSDGAAYDICMPASPA
jgi:hypothetical protein